MGFREFLSEAANRSLNRIIQHSKSGRNIGVVSAALGNDPHEDKRNHEALKQDLKKTGYGYIPVKGVYEGSAEKSFMVIGKHGNDNGHLHKTLKDIGKKYKQASILYKHHNTDHASLVGTKDGWQDPTGKVRKDGEKFHLGPLHANVKEDYMTHLKGKRAFVYKTAKKDEKLP